MAVPLKDPNDTLASVVPQNTAITALLVHVILNKVNMSFG